MARADLWQYAARYGANCSRPAVIHRPARGQLRKRAKCRLQPLWRAAQSPLPQAVKPAAPTLPAGERGDLLVRCRSPPPARPNRTPWQTDCRLSVSGPPGATAPVDLPAPRRDARPPAPSKATQARATNFPPAHRPVPTTGGELRPAAQPVLRPSRVSLAACGIDGGESRNR